MDSPFWCAQPRDVVSAAGPDALTYLQSQLSQDLRALAVGASAYSLVLQPAGKVDVLLRVLRTADETFVLDTDPGAGEALLARLARFKIRVQVELTPLDWQCIAVRALAGPAALAAVDGSWAVPAEHRDGAVRVGPGTWGVPAWRGGGGSIDLLGPSVAPPAGVREGSADELLAARIEAAWPVAGVDYEVGAAIPASLGVTAEAVSFTKGCYPGQELVERMDSRGAEAPRSLRTIDVPAGTQPGATVEGMLVTSVAGTRAIALVHR